MSEITFEDLMAILQECAGVDESVGAGAVDPDTSFEELGYDSLALLETAGRLEQDRGLSLPDEVVAELKTPRQFLAAVNGQASEVSSA